MTKEEMLRLLTAAYTGPGSAAEGTFAGDVLRACADGMAQLWSMEIDGLERRAFVSSAVGEWRTAVCADRGASARRGRRTKNCAPGRWRHWPQRPPPATPTTTPRGADRWRPSCG